MQPFPFVKFLKQLKDEYRPLLPWMIGGGVVFLACIVIFVLIISGKTRRTPQTSPVVTESTTTTISMLIPRHLDGVLVAPEQANAAPWAVMIDNQLDARPQSGLSAANIVIESPVEGGITRLMALFAPTSTLPQIGPVRSARPYFVDWASAWNASYFHVGGSPDALEQIKTLGTRFKGLSEIANGWAFWRASGRAAPHDVMTNGERMQQLVDRKGFASSTMAVAWHFLDNATSAATSTIRQGDVTRAVIAYGGSYSVTWRFEKARNIYVRYVSGRAVKDQLGPAIEADNIVVIKTDAQVLDDKGRLRIRTTGSGDAIAYRDGNKFSLRWRRGPNEVMRFEGEGGTEFLLRPGKTWIQVTTDDVSFAGVEK